VFIDEQSSGSVSEFESRDVIFLENEFPRKGEIVQDFSLYEVDEQNNLIVVNRLVHIPEPPTVFHPSRRKLADDVEPNSTQSQIRHNNCARVPKKYFLIENISYMIIIQDEEKPKNIRDSLTCPIKEKWMKIMEEEMESMRSNNVWKLVDLSEGRETIGNKWVFKIKRLADVSIDRYKARLVAKGYTQQEVIDYEETFSPVMRFTSIRLILAIIVSLDLELHQMNVKTVFLNDNLKEEIYIEQPASFVVEGQEHKVCKLLRLFMVSNNGTFSFIKQSYHSILK
jgi:Reverse transcriptase (RNA-dependent DNA polymerase)